MTTTEHDTTHDPGTLADHTAGQEAAGVSSTVIRATCACGWLGPWQGTLSRPWAPGADHQAHVHAAQHEARTAGDS